MPVLTPQVPDGLIDLMKALTKSILKEKPEKIYEFAVQHFENLIAERDGSLDKGYERFRSEEIYFQSLEKYEKVKLKYQRKQLRTTEKQNSLNAKIDINEKSFGESVHTTPQPVQRKFKTRKLSSRKPSETLIAIKEEDDEEAVKNELDNEMQRRQRAAFKIQNAFRRFRGGMKTGDGGGGKVKMTEQVAALIIQRTLKTIFTRKLAGKKKEDVTNKKDFEDGEKVSVDGGTKPFHLDTIVDTETIDSEEMKSAHHGLKTPLRQNSDDQHPSLAFGERCSENEVNQTTLASTLLSDSILSDEVDDAVTPKQSSEVKLFEENHTITDKLTEGNNAHQSLISSSTEQESLLKLLRNEKSENRADDKQSGQESKEQVVRNDDFGKLQSDQHKEQFGMDASEENIKNIKSGNQTTEDTPGPVINPPLISETIADNSLSNPDINKLSSTNNDSSSLNDSPQEAMNEVQSETKSHIDDTSQSQGSEIEKVKLSDREITNQDHLQPDIVDQIANESEMFKSDSSDSQIIQPQISPADVKNLNMEGDSLIKQSTEQPNESADVGTNKHKEETAVPFEHSVPEPGSVVTKQGSPESLPPEQASLALLLESTKQSHENSNTAAQNHNKEGQEVNGNHSNLSEPLNQVLFHVNNANLNENDVRMTLDHKIDVVTAKIEQQSNQLPLSTSNQDVDKSALISGNEETLSQMEIISTEKQSLIQVLQDEKLSNASNHIPTKSIEEEPSDANITNAAADTNENQAISPIATGLVNQNEENESQAVLEKSLDEHQKEHAAEGSDSVSDPNIENKISCSIIETMADQEIIKSDTIKNIEDVETITSVEKKCDASKEHVTENIPQMTAPSDEPREDNIAKNDNTSKKSDDCLELSSSPPNTTSGIVAQENEKLSLEISSDSNLNTAINMSNKIIDSQSTDQIKDINERESLIEKESLVKLLNHEKDTMSPKSLDLKSDPKHMQDAPTGTLDNDKTNNGLNVDSPNMNDLKKEAVDIVGQIEHELQSKDLLLQPHTGDQSGSNIINQNNVNGLQSESSFEQEKKTLATRETEVSKEIYPQITANDSDKTLLENQKRTADVAGDSLFTSKSDRNIENINTVLLTESDNLHSDLKGKTEMENKPVLTKKDSDTAQKSSIQSAEELQPDSENPDSSTPARSEIEESKIVDPSNQVLSQQKIAENVKVPDEAPKEKLSNINSQIESTLTEIPSQLLKVEQTNEIFEADSLDSTKPPSNFASPIPKEDEEVVETQNENKELYETSIDQSSHIIKDATDKKEAQLNQSKNDVGAGFNNMDPANLLEKLEHQELQAVEEENEALTSKNDAVETAPNYEAEHESLTKSLNDFKNKSEPLDNSKKITDSTNGGETGTNHEILEENLNPEIRKAELPETVRDEAPSIQQDEIKSGKLKTHNNAISNVQSEEAIAVEENETLESTGLDLKGETLDGGSRSGTYLPEELIGITESKLESIQENADELSINDSGTDQTGNDDSHINQQLYKSIDDGTPSTAKPVMIASGPQEPRDKAASSLIATDLMQESNGNEVKVATYKGKEYDIHRNDVDTVDVKSSVDGISDASIIGKQLVEASNDVDMYNEMNNGDKDCDKNNSVPDSECDIKNKEKACDDAASKNVMNTDEGSIKMSEEFIQNESINLNEENYNENMLADIKKDTVDSGDKQGKLQGKIVENGDQTEAIVLRSKDLSKDVIMKSNVKIQGVAKIVEPKNNLENELSKIDKKSGMQKTSTDIAENTEDLRAELKLEQAGQSRLESTPTKKKLQDSSSTLLHDVNDNATITQSPISTDEKQEITMKNDVNSFESNNFENEKDDQMAKDNSADLRNNDKISSENVEKINDHQKDNALLEIEAQIIKNDELNAGKEHNEDTKSILDIHVNRDTELLPLDTGYQDINSSGVTAAKSEKNDLNKAIQKDNENALDSEISNETQSIDKTGPDVDQRSSEARSIETEDNMETNKAWEMTGQENGENKKLDNVLSQSKSSEPESNTNSLDQFNSEDGLEINVSNKAKKNDDTAQEENQISNGAKKKRVDEPDSTQKQYFRNDGQPTNRPEDNGETLSKDGIHPTSSAMSVIPNLTTSFQSIDDNEVNEVDVTEKSVSPFDFNRSSENLSGASKVDSETPNQYSNVLPQAQAINGAEQESKSILESLKDVVSAASLGSIFNKGSQNNSEQQNVSNEKSETKPQETERHGSKIASKQHESKDTDNKAIIVPKADSKTNGNNEDLKDISYLDNFLTSERNTYAEPSASNKIIANTVPDQHLSFNAEDNLINQSEPTIPTEVEQKTKDNDSQQIDPVNYISDSEITAVNKSASSYNVQPPMSDPAEDILKHTSNIEEKQQKKQTIQNSTSNSSSTHSTTADMKENLSEEPIHYEIPNLAAQAEEHENSSNILEASCPSESTETNDRAYDEIINTHTEVQSPEKNEKTTGHRRKRSVFEKNIDEDKTVEETKTIVSKNTVNPAKSDASLVGSNISSQSLHEEVAQSNPIKSTDHAPKSETVEPNITEDLLDQTESKLTPKIGKEEEESKDDMLNTQKVTCNSNGRGDTETSDNTNYDRMHEVKPLNIVENNVLELSKDRVESVDLQKGQPKREKQLDDIKESNEKDALVLSNCSSGKSEHKTEGNINKLQAISIENSISHENQIVPDKSFEQRLNQMCLQHEMEDNLSKDTMDNHSKILRQNLGKTSPSQDYTDVKNLKEVVKLSASNEEQGYNSLEDGEDQTANKQDGDKVTPNIKSMTMSVLSPGTCVDEMASKTQHKTEGTPAPEAENILISAVYDTTSIIKEETGTNLLMGKPNEYKVDPGKHILTTDTHSTTSASNKDNEPAQGISKPDFPTVDALTDTKIYKNKFSDNPKSGPAGDSGDSSPIKDETSGEMLAQTSGSSATMIPQLESESTQKSEVEKKLSGKGPKEYPSGFNKHTGNSDSINQENSLYSPAGESAAFEEHNINQAQALTDSPSNYIHASEDLKPEVSESPEKHLKPVSAIKSFIKGVQNRFVDFVSHQKATEEGSTEKDSIEPESTEKDIPKVHPKTQNVPMAASEIKMENTLSEAMKDNQLQAVNDDISFNIAETLAAEGSTNNIPNTVLNKMVLQTSSGSVAIADDLVVNENKTRTLENDASTAAGTFKVSDEESIKATPANSTSDQCKEKLNEKRVGFSANIPESCQEETMKSNWRKNCPRPDTPANLTPEETLASETQSEIIGNNSATSLSNIEKQSEHSNEPTLINDQFKHSTEESQVSNQLMEGFLVDMFLKSERNTYIEPKISQVPDSRTDEGEVLPTAETSPMITASPSRTKSKNEKTNGQVENSEPITTKHLSTIIDGDYQQNVAADPQSELQKGVEDKTDTRHVEETPAAMEALETGSRVILVAEKDVDAPKITEGKNQCSEAIFNNSLKSALNKRDLKMAEASTEGDIKPSNQVKGKEQQIEKMSASSAVDSAGTKEVEIISKSSVDDVTDSQNFGSEISFQPQDKGMPKLRSSHAKEDLRKRRAPEPPAFKEINVPTKTFGSEEKSTTHDTSDSANNCVTKPDSDHKLSIFDGQEKGVPTKTDNEKEATGEPECLLETEGITAKLQVQTTGSNQNKNDENIPPGVTRATMPTLNPPQLENVSVPTNQTSHQESLDIVNSNTEPSNYNIKQNTTEGDFGNPANWEKKPHDDHTTKEQQSFDGNQSGKEALIEQTLLVAERKTSVENISKKIDLLRKEYIGDENRKKMHMDDLTKSVNSPETVDPVNTNDSNIKPENENDLKSDVGYLEISSDTDEKKSSKLENVGNTRDSERTLNEIVEYSRETDESEKPDDLINRKLSDPNEERYNKFMILSEDANTKSPTEVAKSKHDCIASDEPKRLTKSSGVILLENIQNRTSSQSVSTTVEVPATPQSLNDIEKIISEYNRKITEEFLTREQKLNSVRHFNGQASVSNSTIVDEKDNPDGRINSIVANSSSPVSKNQEIEEPIIKRAHNNEHFIEDKIPSTDNGSASKENEKVNLETEKGNQPNTESCFSQASKDDSGLMSEYISRQMTNEFLATERKLYGPKSIFTQKPPLDEPIQKNLIKENISSSHTNSASQSLETIEPEITEAKNNLQLVQNKLNSEKNKPILPENEAANAETNKNEQTEDRGSKDVDVEFVNMQLSKEFLDTERKFYDMKEKSNDENSTAIQYDENIKVIASKSTKTPLIAREGNISSKEQNCTKSQGDSSSSHDNSSLSIQSKLKEPMSLETSKVINFVETKLQNCKSEESLSTKESTGPEVRGDNLQEISLEENTNTELIATSSLTALSAHKDQVDDMHEDKIISVVQQDDIQQSNADFVLGSTRTVDDTASSNLGSKNIIDSTIQNDINIPDGSKDLENDSLYPQVNIEETHSDERIAKNILQKSKFTNTKVPGHLKTSVSCKDNERHFLDETTVNKSSQSTSNPEIAQVLNAAADTIKKAFRSFIDQKDELFADKQATSSKDKENTDRKTSVTIVETNNTLDENVNNKTRWFVGDDPIIPTIDQEATESLEIELTLFEKPAPINHLEKPATNSQSDVPQSEEVNQTIKTADSVANINLIPHEKLEKSLDSFQEIRETKSEADDNKATEIEQQPITSTSIEENRGVPNVEDSIQSVKTDVDMAENVQQLQKHETSDTSAESPQLGQCVESSGIGETQEPECVEESPKTSPSKNIQGKSSSQNTNIVASEESNEASELTPPVTGPNENENKNISKTSQQESMLDSIEPPMIDVAFTPDFTSGINDDIQSACKEANSSKQPYDHDQQSDANKAQETMLSIEKPQYITTMETTIPTEFLDDVKSSSGVSSSEELPPTVHERQHEVSEDPETTGTTNEQPQELTQALSIDSESSPRTDVENLDISVYGEDSLEAMYYSLKKHELLLDKMHKKASVCKSASSERPILANVDLEDSSQEVSHEKSDSDANTKQIETVANEDTTKHEAPKRKVSRNESYETACALRPITSATVDVREITSSENIVSEPGLNDGTEYSHERKLSRNESYETACTTRPVTSASISPRTKRELDAENPINLAKQRTEQFIQQLHTTPSYNESLDEITAEEIRRNVLAYSISEADSDYCEAAERTNAVFNDFNISTALENTPSTDTDSTIISAVTKIQAGARGFLTRRRLRRASVATTSFSDRRPSFGNDAISESLEDLIEEQDAARRIQKSFRRYRSRKTRQSAPSLRNNLMNESSSKSWNDSSGENAPMIIDVKLEQKQSAKKQNLNGSTSNENTLGETSNSMGGIEEQSTENDSGLNKEDTSISFEGVNLAARRMTLQRGDAVQRNSTGEDENVSVSRSGSDNQDEKDESLSKKLPRSKSSGTERRQNKLERSNNVDRAKRFGPRQKTMPVQIDFEILRVLPRHLRRRIRSADQQNKTKSDF